MRARDFLVRPSGASNGKGPFRAIAVNNQARYLLGKENVLRIDPRVPAADVSIDNLSGLDALVARARHHSRHIMPDVHRQFVGHRAPTFTPLYTQ